MRDKKKKAVPCRAVLHVLSCTTAPMIPAHPGVRGVNEDVRAVGFCSQHSSVPGGISWYLRRFFPLLLRAGCLAPSEKDRSLTADSCSLKGEDFGVSRGLKQRGCCCRVCIVLDLRWGLRAAGTRRGSFPACSRGSREAAWPPRALSLGRAPARLSVASRILRSCQAV